MTNSLTIFQTIMNNIFRGLIVKEIMIMYLNDILIFTQIWEDHHKIVYRVLKILAEHKLYPHSEKCKFDRQRIEYLELVISEDQAEIDPVKIASICSWLILQSRTNMKIFLKFANFYQRFICGFLNIAHSFFDITWSNQASYHLCSCFSLL